MNQPTPSRSVRRRQVPRSRTLRPPKPREPAALESAAEPATKPEPTRDHTPATADETVTAPETADETVTAPETADETVTAPETADETVTAPETADETVTAPETADETVTAPETATETVAASATAPARDTAAAPEKPGTNAARSGRRRLTVRAVSPPGDAATSDAAADGPAGRWRYVVVALVVVLVGVLVGGGLIGRDLYDQRRVEDAHQQATAAARQAAVDFMSISAATVDADIERITGRATGDFRDEFTRGAAQVRKAVLENKVDSKGTVLRTGLVSGDARNAVVLVAVDATVKNKGAPDGRLSHYRVRVGLAKDEASSRWLVSQLQFVG
ncbi:hypothetical protein [Actinoplanes sp. NPDC049265]|uniref:hypothetical protein n=1 Tax=Actinoplanes sp. NPDC049265 TaxID=3363902 RepID=UPI0037170FFA